MRISTKDWKNYIDKLSKLNKEAGEKMSDYVARHGFNDPNIIDYAYGLVTKYGEGSASLSAMMYDAIAEMEGKILPSAEVAETPEYGEVAKAINGVKKHSQNPNSYGNVVNRLVKRTGADTMLKNADRDGAEFAWVPSGDTCAFCIALASRGWQHTSKKSLKNGHAEHIHANCDCNYTVRFDGRSTVEGYDPDEYLEIYENAEGSTPDEKINSIRAKYRAENRDKINAQKRAAYAVNKKSNKKKRNRGRGYDIIQDYLEEATPGKGNFEFDLKYKKEENEKEIETAHIIFNQLGGNIVLKAEKDGQKNPDYLWDGRLWDLKSPTTEQAANSAIKSGMQQIRSNPGGIILNYEDYEYSFDELLEVIDKRMNWYPNECADIMIISKGKIVKILKY